MPIEVWSILFSIASFIVCLFYCCHNGRAGEVCTSLHLLSICALIAEWDREGKVKYLGISECSAKVLWCAHTICPISTIQMEVSPFALEVFHPKLEVLETVRELGITIIAYSPLSHGLMTGQYVSNSVVSSSECEIQIWNRNPWMILVDMISGEQSPSMYYIFCTYQII